MATCSTRTVFLILLLALVVTACRDAAEAFFSGRPSEMSMVHNRIIAGPPEAVLELLRVPSRFPTATESHISLWQYSIIAWWMQEEKRELIETSLTQLTKNERYTLRIWVRVRAKNQTESNSRVLDEIEAALVDPQQMDGAH